MDNVRDQTTILKNIQELCATSGYIHVLSYLSLYSFFLITDKPTINSEVISSQINNPERLVKNEFSLLLGFTIKKKISFGPISNDIFKRLVQETLDLLKELHQCLFQPCSEQLSSAIKETNNEHNNISLVGTQYSEPIFYSGDTAYSHQYQKLSAQRYEKDNDWLKKNKGFIISEAVEIFQIIIKKIPHRLVSLKTRKIENTIEFFEFNINDIIMTSKISSQKIYNIINAFTQPRSPTNANFNNLYDENIADFFPIIQKEKNIYILFDSYNFSEKLYESPFYWMNKDIAYKAIADKHRGEFTEKIITHFLKQTFGENDVYQNIKINTRKNTLGEIDVLVIHANHAIIVQCKSKKLTLEARKGNLTKLHDDFQKAIQDPYNQGLSCAEALLNTPHITLELNNQSTTPLPQFKKIHLICVVAENYPALLFQTQNFLQFTSSTKINNPLICDIFFIDIMTKLLASPLRFIHYLERRSSQLPALYAGNEITILSAYLQTRLEPIECISYHADDIASFVDTKMLQYEKIFNKPYKDEKDFFNVYQGTLLGIILRHIESSQDHDIFNFGIKFLDVDLSKDQIKELSKNILKSQKNAKKNPNHIYPTVLQQSPTTNQMFLFLITNKKHIKKGKVEEIRKTMELKSGATTIYYIVLNAQNSLPIIPF